MEIHEKIKLLRKEQGWTQAQLAEKLYVSRTAVSKWESGKGFPNLESLKGLAKLFAVSIDSLLANEELLDLAERKPCENRTAMFHLSCGLLDLAVFAVLFLPLFGQQTGDFIKMVPLTVLQDTPAYLQISYFVSLLVCVLWGAAELVGGFVFDHAGLKKFSSPISLGLHILVIMLFIMARHPYATAYLFGLFIIKNLLIFKTK